jgi:hypothetical protein
MSQQELVPEPQWERDNGYKNAQEQAYYRSPRAKGNSLPKEEHPSTFEDSVPPYVYRAQDTPQTTQQQRSASREKDDSAQRSRSRPGAESSYYRTRSQRQHFASPTWTRTQRSRNPIWRWLVIVLLIAAAIHFFPVILAVVLTIVGVVAFALLLPVLIAVAIVIGFAILVIIILSLLGVPLRAWWPRRRSLRRRGIF